MKTARELIKLYNDIQDNKVSLPDLVDAFGSEAQERAVAFAEWINRNHYESTLQSKWTNLYEGWLTKGIPSVTTSELFEKFKSENN